MGLYPQPVATHGNGFRSVARFKIVRSATGCHRLQPRGSMKAPAALGAAGTSESGECVKSADSGGFKTEQQIVP
jgi:hypothetical protein